MNTRFYLLLSMTLLLLTQTSCIYDNDIPCGSENPDLLVINLNLTVPSSSTGTRSEDHKLDAGSKDENYINIDGDYQVLMFDRDGTLVEDKLSEFECVKNNESGGIASYTLTAHLKLSGNEDLEKLAKFKVMVLANWESFEKSNTNTGFKYPSFEGYNLSGTANNIYEERAKFNFTFAPTTTESPNCWTPSINDKRAIPMFGITEEVDLQSAIDMAKYGDEPSFHVPMLRSLAKIEIVDMVPAGESANIANCTLTAYNTVGRFIPDITLSKNAQWNDNDYQIGEPSLPENAEPLENLLFVRTTKSVRPKGADSNIERDCFVAYIAEMDLNTTPRPNIQVKLEGSEQLYPIEFSAYDENGKPATGGEYSALLRNHIYRFDITSVGSTELDFLVQTPWQEESAGEWEYDDIKIQFESDKEFNWDWSDVDEETGLPKFESGQIPGQERTIIITQDDWLEGKFKLISPAKAKWTISLYGDDNTLNDHFKVEVGKSEILTDEDGNPVYDGEGEDKKPVYHKEWTPGGPSVSGNVGEDVLFRIVPSAVNNSNDHYVARVVFTITTFDDQIVEVNLPYYHFEQYKVEGSEMTMPTLENNGYFYVKQYYSGFKDTEDENERNGGFGNADSANND